jgi:hypothetical protein
VNINANTTENFWKLNPDLLIPEEFKKLYLNDKTKDKSQSSRIMWVIYLIYHPDSPFANLPHEAIVRLVLKDYLKDPKFDIYQYKEQIKLFEDLILTPGQKQLAQWYKMMNDRQSFIKSLKFTEDSWEMIDKMAVSTLKIYENLKKIQDILEKEKGQGTTKGNSEESASEKGLI